MNKHFFLRLSIVILISILGIYLLIFSNSTKYNDKPKADIIIENSNISESSIEAEELIKNLFKYTNEKDIDKISSCFVHSERYSKENRLFNLEYMDIIEIKLETDRLQYENYINSFLLKQKDLNVEALKIYKVKYNIKFINEDIEPIENGEVTKEYFIVKLNGSDKWLIEAIGTM